MDREELDRVLVAARERDLALARRARAEVLEREDDLVQVHRRIRLELGDDREELGEVPEAACAPAPQERRLGEARALERPLEQVARAHAPFERAELAQEARELDGPRALALGE